jgi:branched-chain amino acid transport system substrate-binding protein
LIQIIADGLGQPHYAAGKDVLSGFKASYKGSVIGEEYTRWPDQLDFSAELSKPARQNRRRFLLSIPAAQACSSYRNIRKQD